MATFISYASARSYLAVKEAAERYPCVAATHRTLVDDDAPTARRAASAAEAAARFGAHWAFVDRVYWWGADPTALRSHCCVLGLDERTIVDQVIEDASASRLDADRVLAEAGNATRAPEIFINGVRWQSHCATSLDADLTRLCEWTRPLWDTAGPLTSTAANGTRSVTST